MESLPSISCAPAIRVIAAGPLGQLDRREQMPIVVPHPVIQTLG
jgi:hypothetical protein